MTPTRQMLDLTLDALEASLPAWLAGNVEWNHSEGFVALADDILEAAGPEDRNHVWNRLQCIQRNAGLIPGDDEPCEVVVERPTPDDDAVSQ